MCTCECTTAAVLSSSSSFWMRGWVGGKDRGGDGWLRSYPLSKELGWFIFVSESARRLDWARETTSQTFGGHEEVERVPNFFSMRFVSSKIFKSWVTRWRFKVMKKSKANMLIETKEKQNLSLCFSSFVYLDVLSIHYICNWRIFKNLFLITKITIFYLFIVEIIFVFDKI